MVENIKAITSDHQDQSPFQEGGWRVYFSRQNMIEILLEYFQITRETKEQYQVAGDKDHIY